MRNHTLAALITGLLAVSCASQTSTPVAQPAAGSPEQGKKLVGEKGCVACHIITQLPEARGTVGPQLDGVGDAQNRRKIAGGVLDNTADNLRKWLSDPPGAKPGTLMPNLNLSKQEIEHLIAFLQTLK